MLNTYYAIIFRERDRYDGETYAGEEQFDTLEEALATFSDWKQQDSVFGIDDYTSMTLQQCGNDEEPTELDWYEFEGTGEDFELQEEL